MLALTGCQFLAHTSAVALPHADRPARAEQRLELQPLRITQIARIHDSKL